jgi:hypothetical protein
VKKGMILNARNILVKKSEQKGPLKEQHAQTAR